MSARRFLRSERGTSMIEFAILTPVLILLVIGVIEIGRYMYFGILAAHAAEAGAHYGAQSLFTANDSAGIRNAAINDGQSLGWTVTPSDICSQSGSVIGCGTGTPPPNTIYYVKVVVQATFHPLLNYPGIPNPLSVTSSAQLRVENQ